MFTGLYTYQTKGVCSTKITIDVSEGIIRKVMFEGGCNGNTQGICSLVAGMSVDEVIRRLCGINCKEKGTSCPDQLAKALLELKKESA